MSEVLANGYVRLVSAKDPEGVEIYFGDTLIVDEIVKCLYVKGPKLSDEVSEYFMLIDVKDGDVYAFSDDMDDLWRFTDIRRVIANWNSEHRRGLADSARLD